LEEVGQQFSVTRERIRQIEAKALRKLKHPSRSKRLRSFLDNGGSQKHSEVMAEAPISRKTGVDRTDALTMDELSNRATTVLTQGDDSGKIGGTCGGGRGRGRWSWHGGRRGGGEQGSVVNVSAFAPLEAELGQQVLVQVYLHQRKHASQVAKRARNADPGTRFRGVETLDCEVSHGQRIHIELEAKGLLIEGPVQSFVWRGTPHACYFSVRLPVSTSEHNFHIRVRVFIEAVPVGSLCFTMGVSSRPARDRQQMIMRGEFAKRYRAAFISYASADRPEVLKRVQVIKQLGIRVFQDILSLDPGHRWKLRLFEEINHCDVFMLFWSRKARASKWVLREADYALKQQRRSRDKLPDIMPVVLDGPPPPRPPKSLQHIHFNDPICYIIASS
jgi:hypothetical protein